VFQNTDKLFGYWVDLGNPLFANTGEGRESRRSLQSIFRMEGASGPSPAECESFIAEMLEKMAFPGFRLDRDDLFFALRLALREQLTLFPTHVGMIRTSRGSGAWRWPFPHARGDDPGWRSYQQSLRDFSPRTWG
jgi:hypothetical protein